MRINHYIYLLCFVIIATSCVQDDPMENEVKTTFGAFEVLENNSVLMTGLINDNTATDLTELIETFPTTTSITMGDVDGATTHEAAFSAARIVRANNLNIHISDNSTIRKEATNFFLGGIQRTKGENVRIGVSAWINDQGQEATDFGFGDSAHLPWINFYQEMGFSFQLAADFYNFYIFAAPSDEIFFMTDDQLNTFDIIN